MLRIESYITPIILSYVDKYIKNLKPEDSQVSLWGGDAVFNNLDLRLEVLEQELRLPFSFVNGHIHELRIHVPWTKLTSEPIVITINTIECILKLKGSDGGGSESSSQSGGGSKTGDGRRRQRRQDIEAPTSYVQGLINRIINNVCIVFNNVILKYVEDDIVLSINVKTLEFRSVDGNWTPAFIDLTAEDLILRNLATLTDLTVCLDKRNASGKIDNYQEPLMYRCSLSCRVVRQFESVNSIQPLCTRYDVFCPQLHFSLSDTQLPMFLRLLELALALYYGDVPSATITAGEVESAGAGTAGVEGEGHISDEYGSGEDSWSSWAWSLGTALLPVYWEEDDPNFVSSHAQRLRHTLHMAIYVEAATWTFKLTESVQDSGYFGPSKMRFTPFLRVEQQGSFMTVVVRGIEAVNVKLGISALSLEPIDTCVCGINDVQEGNFPSSEGGGGGEEKLESLSFLVSGQEGQEYLGGSLFDPQVLMDAQELWDYTYTWDKHMKTTTEASLLAVTGAVAMDYFYFMELPSDINSDKLSEISADLEHSNLSERALCRVAMGSCRVNATSGLYHRLQAVAHCLSLHDYPPYAPSPSYGPPPDLRVPSEDEVASLETNTPTRSYLLTVMEPTLVLHAAQHPTVNMRNLLNARRRKKNQKASGDLCMARVLSVPSVCMKVSRLNVEWTKPMYPKRLVSAASMLRPPSPAMLHNCHSHLTFTAHNVSVGLQYGSKGVTLLQGFSPSLYCKTLLLPLYWTSPHQPRHEYFFQADGVNVSWSAAQVMLLWYVISSWWQTQPHPEALHQNTLVDDALDHKWLAPLCLKVHNMEAKLCDTPSLRGCVGTLAGATLTLLKPSGDLLCLLMSGPEDKTGLEVLLPDTISVSDKLLKVALQFPKTDTDESVPSVLTLGMKKTAFLFDPLLIQWLKYSPRKIESDILSEMVVLKKISEVRGVQIPSQRKPSENESEATKIESSTATLSEAKTESRGKLHFSHEPQDNTPKTWKEKFVSWYPILSRLLIHADIDTATFFLPSSALNVASESGLVNAVHRTYLTRSERVSLGDTLVICLPHIILHNAAQKQSLLHNVHDVPVILPADIWATEKDKLPWSLSLGGFSVYSLQGSGQHVKLPVLKPVNTTATLAITSKCQGPSLSQLGLVIHTDMSPLEFCGSRCQVAGHVVIVQNILGLIAHFTTHLPKSQSSSKSSTPVPPQQPSAAEGSSQPATSQPQPTPQPQPSQAKPFHHSSSDPNTLLVPEVEEAEEERATTVSEPEVSVTSGPVVTAWVQWTVARVSASLYAREGEAGEARKLRAEMEDLTTALDLHRIYSKVKVKVTSFSILHYTRRNNTWVVGEHEGVVLTCGDHITRDVKVINPRSGSLDPHHPPPKATPASSSSSVNTTSPPEQTKTPPHGFLSVTLTTALCRNIHSTWNSLIKKHLSEDRSLPRNTSSDHYLSEVDVRVQPFDCVFYPASLHMFAAVYEPWLQLQVPRQMMNTGHVVSKEPLGIAINNHTLPLVYLHTESIRVFFPAGQTSTQNPTHTHKIPTSKIILSENTSKTSTKNKATPLEKSAKISTSVLSEKIPMQKMASNVMSLESTSKLTSSDIPGSEKYNLSSKLGSPENIVAENVPQDSSLKDISPPFQDGSPFLKPTTTAIKDNCPSYQDSSHSTKQTTTLKDPSNCHPDPSISVQAPSLSLQDPSAHNFFLAQLDSIVVTPQVDNPLSRIMIRADVFHTAERARILGIPGSEVEDRQYQVDLVGFSVSTGSWFDLVQEKGGRPRSSSGERLGVMGENPALEWNNYDPTQDSPPGDIVLHPFVARFDSRVIAAPAIVHRGCSEEGQWQDTLVAGHSVEVNATSDIDLHLSLPQIHLLHHIVQDTTRLMSQMLWQSGRMRGGRPPRDLHDSGVDCDVSSVELTKGISTHTTQHTHTTTITPTPPPSHTITSTHITHSFVPLELLVTAGKITASIFDRGIVEDGQKLSVKGWQRSKLEQRARKREKELVAEAESTESEPSPKKLPHHQHHHHTHKHTDTDSHSEKEVEDGYEGSEEGSVCEGDDVSPLQPRISPLLYLVMSQPHAFLSCQPLKQRLDVSCFNFILRSVLKGFSVKATEGKQLPCEEDYTTSWLETKPGDPHPKTGIPPALLLITATDFLHRPARVNIEVGRPVRFCISESRCHQVLHVASRLSTLFPPPPPPSIPPVTKSTLDLEIALPEKLRQALAHLDSISVTTSQIVINCEMLKGYKAKSEVHMSVSGMKFCLGTSRKKQHTSHETRIETKDTISEVTANSEIQDFQIKTIYHSQKLQPLLKPWTVSGEVKLLWLQWSTQPYTEIKVDTETVALEAGPEHLFCLSDMLSHISPLISKGLNGHQAKQKPQPQETHHDILYQDDLRGGIFQYVSLALDDPRPYQVVFDKIAGTMVWCYPEPRTLTRVDIYPVPFIAASDYSTVPEAQEKDQVLCALQYFDSLRETFITYRQFHLSESKFCQLDLPSFYEKQHIAVSSMWRVCIDFTEDESNSGDGRIVVSPAALAACMRVDSMFSVDLLPRTQAIITIGQAQLTLFNHLALTGKKLPRDLQCFTLDKLAPEEQPFLTFTLENAFLRGYIWSTAMHCQVGLSAKMDVLSYTYLTNTCLLEPTFMEASFVHQEAQGPDKPSCLDSVITMKPMFLHVNQSIIHTLNIARDSWAQIMSIVPNPQSGPDLSILKKSPVIFMTNYLICNDMADAIRFGQVGTEESLFLGSRGLHLYCWRTHKLPPKLHACVECGKWKWCDPFLLDVDGPQVHTIHHDGRHFHFLVTIETLSPTQRLITFSGLLSVANCLPEDLELRVVETGKERESPKHPSTHALNSGTVAPSYVGDAHGIRVRILGGATVWSGEIPLSVERTKESVLVKIPLRVKGESVVAWCRVIRQRVVGVWRLMVILSPQYVVRSHLPRPLLLHINTPSAHTASQVVVKGRGHTHTLHCDGSVAHHLTFQLNPEYPVSSPPIPLSRALTDQMRQSQSQDTSDISQCLRQMFVGPEERWPYVETSNFVGDVLFADQPKIDLQVGFSSLYPQCNTVVVDIRPWALIINHTGVEIVLQEVNNNSNPPSSCWFVPPGAVFAPPKLDAMFTFGLMDGEQHFHTQTLQLSKEDRWYSLTFEGRIPRHGTTPLRIPTQDKMYFLTVHSTYEENIQILHLLPTYSITNNTTEELTVRSMYVYAGDIKIQLPVSLPSLNLPPRPPVGQINEVPLILWHILKDAGSSSSDEEVCCIQIGQDGYQAHPVVMRDGVPDQRMTITLPSADGEAETLNRSLVVTCHKHNGQVKMVLQDDPAPQMVIHNNTRALLILGQSSVKEDGIMEEELDLFAAMPSVPGGQAVHYTCPHISHTFPHIPTHTTQPPYRLHFSQPDVLNNAETEEVLWSQGVDIQQHYDQFVSIPGHGDVKVRIERVAHTSHVFIDPVSRVEVSARDIRSRIAAEPSKGRVATSTNKGRSMKDKEGLQETEKLEKTESTDTCTTADNSPVNLPATSESKVDENLAVPLPSVTVKKQEKSTRVMYCTFVCTQVVLVLKDDVSDKENIMEILRVSLDNFIISLRPKIDLSEKLRALDYRVKEQMEVVLFVGDAQIDNQLHSHAQYDFPVILIRQDPDSSPKLSPLDPIEQAMQRSHNSALFTLTVILEPSSSSSSGTCLHSVHLKLKPITLYAEDAVFYSLMEILSSFVPAPRHEDRTVGLTREKSDDEENLLPVIMRMPKDVLIKSEAMTHPIHITNLTIEPVSVLLSVHASVKLYLALDRSPLTFGQYQRSEIMTTSYSLGHNLTMHYLSGALIRAGWVVGSLDLLGNPGGFARTVGSGVRDFVQLPYEGILQGPWAFIAGITHGSLSLVKHLTAGTVVSVTNLASSVARNMERLSLDQDHAQRSEAARRYHPSGLVHGLVQGLSAFGISLLGAVGGIAHQPMQALMSESVSAGSVVSGVGRGLVGIVTKPIGGAADLLVHTGQGLLQGAGWREECRPRYPACRESHRGESNAALKLVWKLVAALPLECRAVLAAVDATHCTPATAYTPVTVLLTPQVLFILGMEEDAQQHALPLSELTFRAHTSDPTLLYLDKLQPPPPPQNPDMEPISGCPERVADYVRSTCSEGVDVGAHDSPLASDDDENEDGSCSHPTRIKLYVSPRFRPALISAINIASRATQGRGFIV